MARRSFLRSCGGSAALLLPLLRGIEARAQGVAAPLRFLVIRRACGSPLEAWRPADAATTTSYALPAQSAPFAPLQPKMVLVDGLNMVTASLQSGNNGGQNTAEGGTVAVMTGVPTLGQIGQQDHAAGGPSIDQLLLAQSPVLGGAGAPTSSRTPFGSLQLAADIRSNRDEVGPRVLSYLPPIANADIAMARQPLYPETQPLDVFTRLFAGATGGTASGASLLQKLSVLDFMRSDLARLETLIPASEKPRLLAHADAIQKLEDKLRMSLAPPPGSACVVPAAPPLLAQTGKGYTPPGSPVVSQLTGCDYYTEGDPASHPHEVAGRLHLELIKAAFLCDLARVATFSWSSGTSGVVFPTTMDGATLPVSSPAAPHYAPLQVDPGNSAGAATAAWGAAIDRFYSTETAQALQAFDAATDVDGGSLLDNTVVVYLCELSRAWDHNQMNVPLLVFGGKNTRIKAGTFLKVTDGPYPSQTGSPSGNRPFNDLWLALAPLFGVNLTSLGTVAQYRGPLPGLIA
jgi:hypothetical protein